MNVIERYESAAQHFVRSAPVMFNRAMGAELIDEEGKRYIDFYSGGGTLTYGHNNVKVCTALIDYLCNDRVVQTRDKSSVAKREFIRAFVQTILEPRNLHYKILFADPASGTSAEAALRIARRVRKRSTIVAFTDASHGLTEGAATVGARAPSKFETIELRSNTVFMPYCGYLGEGTDTLAYFRRFLEDGASGIERPAAVIVSAMQDDGGLQIASAGWLQSLAQLCKEFDMLLILDETQTGCGRTGPFFAFERANIVPDMVLVPSAIAGGLPASMLLLRPDLDHWRPGEQTGIFNGDSLAFVAATELLSYWRNDNLRRDIDARSAFLAESLNGLIARFPKSGVRLRGLGMAWGLDFGRSASAAVISGWALERGLVVEAARLKDQVLLVLPPVTIAEDTLREGLDRLAESVAMFLAHE